MANFLGPSYGNLNADSNQSLYNEVIGHEYSYLTNYDGATALDFRRTANEQQVSTMFTLGVARQITSIEVWMKSSVTLVGDITLTIFPEGASVGIPATAGSLGASAAVDAATLVVGTYAKVKFTFASAISLSAGTNYYAVLTSTVVVSATDYMQIASDATPIGYVRSAKYNGAVWAAQSYTSCFIVYYKTTTKVSQGFLVSGDQELDSVIIWGSITGAPSGNLSLEIRDDNAGVPNVTGPVNGISSPVLASGFISPQTFTFPIRPELLDGQTYHFVLSNSAPMTSSAFVRMSTDATTPTFGPGKVSVDNLDGTWRVVEQDAIFEVYYFEQVTPNTLGDELALLGDPPVDCRAQQVWLKALVNTLSSFYPSILPELYGGTGQGSYDAGDMLYASSSHHLERLPIGTTGQLLAVRTDGLPSWGAGGSNLVVSAWNAELTALNPGDVVVYALTFGTPKSVKLTTKIGDRLFAGVVQDIIPPGEFGSVVIEGIIPTRINGSVTAGDYLDTASVSRRAYKTDFGPMKALKSGASGSLVDSYVNAALSGQPYTRFAEIQAFNVNGPALVAATWTATPLNTSEYVSHSTLYTLAANQITFLQTGTYRIESHVPFGLATVANAALLSRFRKVNGTPADFLSAQSTAVRISTGMIMVVDMLGEALITAGDVVELQSYAASITTLGVSHAIAGFNNRYSTLELWKIKD